MCDILSTFLQNLKGKNQGKGSYLYYLLENNKVGCTKMGRGFAKPSHGQKGRYLRGLH